VDLVSDLGGRLGRFCWLPIGRVTASSHGGRNMASVRVCGLQPLCGLAGLADSSRLHVAPQFSKPGAHQRSARWSRFRRWGAGRFARDETRRWRHSCAVKTCSHDDWQFCRWFCREPVFASGGLRFFDPHNTASQHFFGTPEVGRGRESFSQQTGTSAAVDAAEPCRLVTAGGTQQ